MSIIFVSALPFKISESELRGLFAPFGRIESIAIHADWENASYEPYAHIKMENAEKAINALDGKMIQSTYLRVNTLVSLHAYEK